MTIDVKLKTYEQLQFEITKLNTDIFLKDKEIERLNNIINECAEEILKELQENHHLSYGVALATRQKLINYRELKENGNNEN